MVKRFFIKCICLTGILALIALIIYHTDTFNVFHWKSIRSISSDWNVNFIKTQYIVHNPDKYNAFIFGSSRVGGLPYKSLPHSYNGKELNWYNMTYPSGIPSENLLSIKTFLNHGVHVDFVLVGFDNISMYASLEEHEKNLLRRPYQVYEKSKWDFYQPYITNFPEFPILKEVFLYTIGRYDREQYKNQRHFLYNPDNRQEGVEFSLIENPQEDQYAISTFEYSQKESYRDLEELFAFCAENNIPLVLFTSPLYHELYRYCAKQGYLEFLQQVGERCEFYNFSSLNNYSKDRHYYAESSHYVAAFGQILEKFIFCSESKRAEIRAAAGDDYFGIKVNAKNVTEVINHLHQQLDAE